MTLLNSTETPASTAVDLRDADMRDAQVAALGEGGVLVIPVLAEDLQVGRRQREGKVRIRKVVHQREQVVDEPSQEQYVTVDRVAVGRTLDGPVEVRYEGDVMIVPVVEERLVVEKRLVLLEELHVRRETRRRSEPQHVTLRREEVVVERYDPATDEWMVVVTPLQAATPASAADGQSGFSASSASAELATPAKDVRSTGTATNPLS